MDAPVETIQIKVADNNVAQPETPPPSYHSFMKNENEVVKIKKEDNGESLPITGLLCRIILPLAIINGIAIAAITLGSVNINNCVREPKIPIFLIVFGILIILIFGLKTPSISKQLSQILQTDKIRAPFSHQYTWMKNHKNCVCSFLSVLILLIVICFICMQVWVYTNYNGFYNVGSSKTYVVNCDKDLYLFAFWLIAVVYLSVTVLPLAVCLCSVGFSLLILSWIND